MLDFIRFSLRLGLLATVFLVVPTAKGSAGDVLVFAASSLTLPLTEAARGYETRNEFRIRLSFASSSVLAKQLHRGAPAAVFLSANLQWMEHLVEGGIIDRAAVRPMASNRLVVAVSTQRPSAALDRLSSIPGLLGAGRLALGDPAHVPAGQYAKAALTNAGIWNTLQDQLIPAANVRAALRFIELNQAGAGIVYATDALRNDRVRVVHQIDPAIYPPVRYLAAPIQAHADEYSRAFLDHLFSAELKAILARYGFVVD